MEIVNVKVTAVDNSSHSNNVNTVSVLSKIILISNVNKDQYCIL